MKTINNKLGAEWKFVIDWAGIRKEYPERLVFERISEQQIALSTTTTNSALKDADGPGFYVIRNVVKGIASDDVNKFDATHIAALNAKVGTKKIITLTSGVKGASYAYGSRTNVAADSTKAHRLLLVSFRFVCFASLTFRYRARVWCCRGIPIRSPTTIAGLTITFVNI